MEKLSLFKHKTEEHVRYNDLDTLGHVNHARYLSYLEDARVAYSEDVIGFDRTTLEFQAVVGTVNIKYLSPINYGDKVELYTRCSRIGKKSFDFQTQVVKYPVKTPQEQIVAAESTVTLVAFDSKTQSTIEHSADTVRKIQEFEGEDSF